MKNNNLSKKLINEIIFKLESEKYEIFIDEFEDVVTLLKNICCNCYAKWHQDYNQCIFCSSVNYQLFTCEDCGSLSSITNASGKWKCSNLINHRQCTGTKGKKDCINKECPSNEDAIIRDIVDKITGGKGLFNNKKGSFFVSQMWCLSCGNKKNKHITSQLKILVLTDDNDLLNQKFDQYDNYILIKDGKFQIINKNLTVYNNLEFKDELDLSQLQMN